MSIVDRMSGRQPEPVWTALTYQEIHVLAAYNAERARGLMHTTDWQARMAELQVRFDADAAAWNERWATGWTGEQR